MIPVLVLLTLGLTQTKGAKAPRKTPPKTTAPAKTEAKTTAPDAPVTYHCTLVLKGSLTSRKSWANDGKPGSPKLNVEARQDTFEVQVAGALKESPQADGSVEFSFEPDNGRPATGFLESTVSLVTPAGSEQRAFKGTQFQPMGSSTFRARYRGQALYASGNAFNAIGEADVSVNGGPTKKERRLLDLGPLMDLRKDDKDFRAPSLGFTGLSLWALRNSPGNFTAQGTITYQQNLPAAQISGKVDVGFRIGAKVP